MILLRKIIINIGGILPFILLFSTVLVINDTLANGIVTGKYFWFYGTVITAAFASILSFILNKNKTIKFEITDLIVLLYSLSLILFMRKIDGICQKQMILPLIICLYFFFRFFLASSSFARYYLSLFFICTGLVEALIGLSQLYSLGISHHNLFRVTGTFFNPGPYAGYVAMVAPMALYYTILDRKVLKSEYNKSLLLPIIRLVISSITVVASLLILPATMSRASWLGVAGGFGFILFVYLWKGDKINEYLNISKIKIAIISFSLIVLLVASLVGMYYLKKDSADGRALMWKISLSVISDNITGSGLGTFPAVYGKAQAKYFEDGKGSETEEHVAGNPEYAFNEYLQIGIEQGIIPLVLFLLFLSFTVYSGIKKKSIAATGSLVALAIFAFASYPFSVLPFLIGLSFLLAVATTGGKSQEYKKERADWKYRLCWISVIVVCMSVTVYCVYTIYPTKAAYKSWNKHKILYQSGLYQDAMEKYAEIAPQLSDQVPFLFEYAQSLSKSGEYNTSNEVLEKAVQISCDPMLYNIMGKNYQALKEYAEAEKYFLKSSYIVPNKMYPYYLLTKMYLEAGQLEKARNMAQIVLTKEPKVHSTAIEEMRREAKKFPLMNKQKIKQILKTTFQGIVVVLISIVVALSLRIFLFASFKIPSPSMVPSIEAGENILVSKLIPGPRVYKNFDFLDGKKVETRRFKGIRTIKRNDILVFNFPYIGGWNKIKMDLGVNYVKRCIAIPGDTFYIENGIFKVRNISEVLGHLPYQQQLSKLSRSEFLPGTYHCFPFDSVNYNWNIKDFGPLYIPRKGDQLKIDTVNYRLYKNLIEYETDKTIRIESGKVYLDGQAIDNYEFTMNYYFMSGDWVMDSKDSRYWGLLPEDHIIGKAWMVWKSQDPNSGKYRWKRFFKIIK